MPQPAYTKALPQSDFNRLTNAQPALSAAATYQNRTIASPFVFQGRQSLLVRGSFSVDLL